MREWVGFVIALAVFPITVVDDFILARKYEALQAAERQRRVDEANGL